MSTPTDQDHEAVEKWADRATEWFNFNDTDYQFTITAFKAGAAHGRKAERERAAKIAWSAVRNVAEKMDHADECALMADFAESAIRAGGEKEKDAT